MTNNTKKIIAVILIIILVVNVTLFALGKNNIYILFGILLLAFLYTKFIQPKL